MIHTRVCDLLNVDHPVALGGMPPPNAWRSRKSVGKAEDSTEFAHGGDSLFAAFRQSALIIRVGLRESGQSHRYSVAGRAWVDHEST